jgi:hypothetical protein
MQQSTGAGVRRVTRGVPVGPGPCACRPIESPVRSRHWQLSGQWPARTTKGFAHVMPGWVPAAPLRSGSVSSQTRPAARRTRSAIVPLDRAVASYRRGIAATVLLDVPQPLGRRICKRRTGADHAGERASPCLVEHRAQPVPGCPLREVASGRTTAIAPCGSDPLLHLAAVRQPVLRVPDRPRGAALPGKRVPWAPAIRRPWRVIIRGSRDTFGDKLV